MTTFRERGGVAEYEQESRLAELVAERGVAVSVVARKNRRVSAKGHRSVERKKKNPHDHADLYEPSEVRPGAKRSLLTDKNLSAKIRYYHGPNGKGEKKEAHG